MNLHMLVTISPSPELISFLDCIFIPLCSTEIMMNLNQTIDVLHHRLQEISHCIVQKSILISQALRPDG
jgi:hypothetical protein